ETFSQQALVELHRRGVEQADAVCAVTDGAEWLQGFTDDHCPKAIRILDFAHAAEYVSAIGQLATEAGSELSPNWLEEQLHSLKHEGPEPVLAQLRTLQVQHPSVALLSEKLAYLEKREAHMQYPTYQEAGWPIGSGMVESANKLIVEARLKGAGMHWEPAHVNPMLALRTAVCSERWDEAWQEIIHQQRSHRHMQRRQVALTRLRSAPTSLMRLLLRFYPSPPKVETPSARLAHPAATLPGSSRPSSFHPWKRTPACRPKLVAKK